jgi:hypothetical protein
MTGALKDTHGCSPPSLPPGLRLAEGFKPLTPLDGPSLTSTLVSPSTQEGSWQDLHCICEFPSTVAAAHFPAFFAIFLVSHRSHRTLAQQLTPGRNRRPAGSLPVKDRYRSNG